MVLWLSTASKTHTPLLDFSTKIIEHSGVLAPVGWKCWKHPEFGESDWSSVDEISMVRRFLNAFNAIEKILIKQQNGREDDDRYEAFTSRVRKSTTLNAPAKDLLQEYAKLRNVIVHEPWTAREEPIASPLPATVERIERILENLEKPPTVFGTLGQQKIAVLGADDEISEFLDKVDDPDNYSQSPVRGTDGELHLITTNAVARRVAKSYHADDGALVHSATVGDVLKFVEDDTDRLVLGGRGMKVVEAIRKFSGEERTGKGGKISLDWTPPAALIITENGKATEAPLCICTKNDLGRLYRALGF